MKLNHHFNKFHSVISLDSSRKQRISSAISNLENFLKDDEEMSKYLLEFFVQGSFAADTAIKPSENNEFDVDVVLLFNTNELPEKYRTPEELIGWVATRLRENKPHYDGRVRERNRCIRINYAGDFHLDIVPANCNGNVDMPIWIPNKKDDNWEPSHPKGYIEWILNKNNDSNKKLCRIMKMLKHWRDHHFGVDSCPSSILLTTLVGEHMENGCSSDAEALTLTMENLADFLKSINFVPAVMNPSLSSENLARNWDEEHFNLFKTRFIQAATNARQAYDEEDRDKSIETWQKLFPDFPSSIEEEARAVGNAIKASGAFATITGKITEQPGTGTLIKPHRTYGD